MQAYNFVATPRLYRKSYVLRENTDFIMLNMSFLIFEHRAYNEHFFSWKNHILNPYILP